MSDEDRALELDIRVDDLTDARTRDLLRIHLQGMGDNSPPGHVFALDLSGLQRPDVTVLTAWEGQEICGVGALRQFADGTGEVKSMRTHPDHLGKGVGTALLEAIIKLAVSQSLTRLSLETGSGPAFEPALRLYRRRGFVSAPPFADYVASEFNQFMTLPL